LPPDFIFLGYNAPNSIWTKALPRPRRKAHSSPHIPKLKFRGPTSKAKEGKDRRKSGKVNERGKEKREGNGKS